MKICSECQTEYSDEVEFCAQDGMKLRPIKQAGDDPMIGQALEGRWIVEEKIGEGGMGAVYKGKQRSVNRIVAIKTLRPALADNEEFVTRFFREAKIASMISHPHCVTVLDFGQTSENILFLAMEFLDGQELSERLSEGGLTQVQIIKIGVQIASALSAAHGHQIIHRDLKPDNIFLLNMSNDEIFAKVLDFGIAKDANDDHKTRTGQIFGTPEYMSPEQCSGQDLDGRSDLYSLGCILYEIVTGHPPFQGNNPMSILMGHVSAEVIAPSAQGVQLWPGLEDIILKLLQKEPSARFADANALVLALKEALSNLEGQTAIRRSQGFTGPIIPPTTPAGSLPLMDTVDQVAQVTPQHLNPTPYNAPMYDEDELEPAAPNRRPLLIAASLFIFMLIGAATVAIVIMNQDDAKDGPLKDDKVAAAKVEPSQHKPVEPVDPVKTIATPEETPPLDAPSPIEEDTPPEQTPQPEVGAKAEELEPDEAPDKDTKPSKSNAKSTKTKRTTTKEAPPEVKEPPKDPPKAPPKEEKPKTTTKTKKLDGIIDDLNL